MKNESELHVSVNMNSAYIRVAWERGGTWLFFKAVKIPYTKLEETITVLLVPFLPK
jgi:hypothetical protein